MRLGAIHLDVADPTGSPSPPGQGVTGDRSAHRSKPTHVSEVPTPITLVLRQADVPAS
jgi:hypothetical protein